MASTAPKISEEPQFLDRTAARRKDEEETSFICVPIQKGTQVVGTLSADFPYAPTSDLKASERRQSLRSRRQSGRTHRLRTRG